MKKKIITLIQFNERRWEFSCQKLVKIDVVKKGIRKEFEETIVFNSYFLEKFKKMSTKFEGVSKSSRIFQHFLGLFWVYPGHSGLQNQEKKISKNTKKSATI